MRGKKDTDPRFRQGLENGQSGPHDLGADPLITVSKSGPVNYEKYFRAH